jgi:ATP-dependent helicase IRC3
MNLRPYQIECVETILNHPSRKQVVSLPTGTGKTVIFTELIRRQQGRTVVLVHRDELVRQTMAKLADAGMVDTGYAGSVGIIQANRNDIDRSVTVASVQSLCQDRRLISYLQNGEASLVIVDEAHHAPAPSYRKVIDAVLAEDGLLVGVTATPDRETRRSFAKKLRDGRHVAGTTLTAGMGSIFDNLTYYRSLTDMIGEGWLCDIVPATIQTDIDLASIKQTAGDWQEGALGEAMEASHTEIDLVDAWLASANNRPTIAFLPTVATSRAVAAEFERRGIAAEHIDGTTPTDLRQDTYKRLREGTTKVVTNCMVLTEGFDEPCVSCIIVARPTQSRSLFAQMIGRGTRLYPNKPDCLVMSVVNHSLDVSPVTLQTFLNDPGWPDEQPMAARKKAVAELEEARTQEQQEAKEQALKFTQAFKVSAKAQYLWRRVGTTWRLPLGKDANIILTETSDHHFASNQWDDNLPLDGAVAKAEQWARDNNKTQLVDPNAHWRADRPSDAQLVLAAKLGINATQMSKGQLSEAISERTSDTPTVAQVRYARYLGCVNPETMTKREIGRWISANKPGRMEK